MKIERCGARADQFASDAYFTGTVRQEPIIVAPDPARVRAMKVTFEAGARTNWHTHPLGQTIYVVSGLGRAQREGGPIEEIRPGDTVWFEPGERHWHGAAPNNHMCHIAIQEALDGKHIDWEEPVSDDDYGA